MPVALKAAWEVRAGIVPGTTRHELTRQWVYTSLDYEADRKLPPEQETKFVQLRKEATDYWVSLNDPRQHNWADLTWIWY
jgi:hypothetical protein